MVFFVFIDNQQKNPSQIVEKADCALCPPFLVSESASCFFHRRTDKPLQNAAETRQNAKNHGTFHKKQKNPLV